MITHFMHIDVLFSATMRYAFIYYRDLISTNSNTKLTVMHNCNSHGEGKLSRCQPAIECATHSTFFAYKCVVSAYHPIFFHVLEEY